MRAKLTAIVCAAAAALVVVVAGGAVSAAASSSRDRQVALDCDESGQSCGEWFEIDDSLHLDIGICVAVRLPRCFARATVVELAVWSSVDASSDPLLTAPKTSPPVRC